jgi:retinol dehydrogenase-12
MPASALPLPDLTGKTALVTGANTGIGLVTAKELARAGARVWLACRNKDKADAAMQHIRAEVPAANLAFLQLDLGDLAQIRQAAKLFLDTQEPLHLLINNAGLAGTHGLTKDGFEVHFGTNHLGPYLLTRLLLDRVVESGPSRIVCVASRAHYRSKGLPFERFKQSTPSKTGLPQYSDSKLCNVLFVRSLAKRLQGSQTTTYSLHPGVVASDIWRHVPQPFRWIALRFMITNEQGAQTSLYCATSPACGAETGLYYDDCARKTAGKLGRDDTLAETLWQRSAEWAGLPS